MKKLLAALALLVILLPAAATAEEIDLSGYSFAQLRNLQQRVHAELVTRPEWKEVTVPAGEWIVGEDIPAGSYAISLPDYVGHNFIHVWGFAKNDYITNGGLVYSVILDATDNPILGKAVLREHYVLDLEKAVVLSPVASLGF